MHPVSRAERNRARPLALAALGLFAGCAVETRPLNLTHPAHPEAPELSWTYFESADSGDRAHAGAGSTDPEPAASPEESPPASVEPSGNASHESHGGSQAPASADAPSEHSGHEGSASADPRSEPTPGALAHAHDPAAPPGDTVAAESPAPSGHDHDASTASGPSAKTDEKSPFPMLQRIFPGLARTRNVHPIFVHFPIALWPTALLFWILGVARRQDTLLATSRWLLVLALSSSLVSAGTGLLAEQRLGHDSPGHELVHAHKYFMLTTTGLGLATTLMAFLTRRRAGPWPWVWGSGLIVTVAVMTLGADRGGLLVYGHGVGTTPSSVPAAAQGEQGHHAPGGHP